MGNIQNRVFDSSGPEGKVRGTPQQIIDKYTQLARDAQLANDRVAAENFQQHAEHYTRMLGEAQREMEARRDAQEGGQPQGSGQGGQQQGGQQQGGGQNGQKQGGARQSGQGGAAAQESAGGDDRRDGSGDAAQDTPAGGNGGEGAPDVIDPAEDSTSTLVETPESAPKPKRSRARGKSRSKEAKEPKEAEAGSADEAQGASDTAEGGPDTKQAAE